MPVSLLGCQFSDYFCFPLICVLFKEFLKQLFTTVRPRHCNDWYAMKEVSLLSPILFCGFIAV